MILSLSEISTVGAGWDGALEVEIFSTPELFSGLPVEGAARAAYAAISALA